MYAKAIKKKVHMYTAKKNGLGGKRKAVERFVKNGVSTKKKQQKKQQQNHFALSLKRVCG